MGLNGLMRGLPARLAHWASTRPHVLLVVAPGETALRLEAERAVATVCGRAAYTPADADVLMVVGTPAAPVRAAADELWAQMPGPRVRTELSEPGDAEHLLGEARLALADAVRNAEESQRRTDEWQGAPGHAPEDGDKNGGSGEHRSEPDGSHIQGTETPEQGGHAKGGHGAEDNGDDDGGRGHDDHAGHGGGMEMPGGLGMADRADDRDGLKLDVLHVPLGPVLPFWPPGLVVDTRLQGDVVQHAEARVLAATRPQPRSYWDGPGQDDAANTRLLAAAHLDSLSRLLSLAGWAAAAGTARVLRDRLLGGEPAADVGATFAPWQRRLERSRLLRWSTDGLGVLTPDRARRFGVGGPAARAAAPYDATARWRQWLLETRAALDGAPCAAGGPRGRSDGDRPASRPLLEAAVALMPGLDLTAARLVLASFDPDTDELAPETEAEETQ